MRERINLYSDSFEAFYKDYYPKLAAFASLFLKNDEAHDIVQDVFLNILETSHKDRETLNAYLYRAVKNKCIDLMRHRIVENQYASDQGQKLLEKESEYFYASHNEIEHALFSKELQEKIDATVEELSPKAKEVFKLFFYQHQSAKEISDSLNISKSTVENHLYNAMKVMRLKLTRFVFVLLSLYFLELFN